MVLEQEEQEAELTSPQTRKRRVWRRIYIVMVHVALSPLFIVFIYTLRLLLL